MSSAVKYFKYIYLKYVFKLHRCTRYFVFRTLLSKYKIHYKIMLHVSRLDNVEVRCVASCH